jgi:predicted deacetylase
MRVLLFLKKYLAFIKEIERLDIKYNIALVPFFNEKQDLPRFPEFVNRIKSCKGEIVLHGLYHEDRNAKFDDFFYKTRASAASASNI